MVKRITGRPSRSSARMRPRPSPTAAISAASPSTQRTARVAERLEDGLDAVLGLEAEAHDVELERADRRQDRLAPAAGDRVEELDRALFLDLGQPLEELLVAVGPGVRGAGRSAPAGSAAAAGRRRSRAR